MFSHPMALVLRDNYNIKKIKNQVEMRKEEKNMMNR
jgi:hypothetical protein